jgi:hypothetical protein
MIRTQLRRLAGLAAISVGATRVAAQTPPARVLQPPTVTLDTLLQTSGPRWSRGQSRHFAVYFEQPADAIALNAMVDSLEVAWSAATRLLDQPLADESRDHIFVTRSRTRFAGLVSPEAKGLTTRLRSGEYITILVRNDSVRAYTRHEVMHLVSWRAWGMPGASRAWLAEGLATFADGRCQTSTVLAVSRDLLAARPMLRAQDVIDNFVAIWRTERAAAYVFAGSLVDYLWASRGRDGVRRLWSGSDTLTDVGALPGTGGALTSEWRAYVVRKAEGRPGLTTTAFLRAGCG